MLERYPSRAYDWVDPKNGKTYDAVASVKAEYFNEASVKSAIVNHVYNKQGLDVTVIDVTRMSPRQISIVEGFVKSLPARGTNGQPRTKILIVYPESS